MTMQSRILAASAAVIWLCPTLDPFAWAAVSTVKITNTHATKTLKDVTLKVKGGERDIRGVTDNGRFGDPANNTDFSRNRSAVAFDLGDVEKGGGTTTVILDTLTAGTKFKVIKKSYTDNSESMISLGLGTTVIPGGDTGRAFAGVEIPARHYGYFYESWYAPTFDQSPYEFRIQLGYVPPVSMGVLDDSWFPDDVTDDVRELAPNEFALQDDLTEEMLSGIPGESAEWFFDGDSAVAAFPSGLAAVGDHGSVMYLVHPAGPLAGGPLGLLGDNLSIQGEMGELLYSGSMLAPIGVLPGDFNFDGSVNVTDYTLWRLTYGSTEDLSADANRDGTVNAADYTLWRNSFGGASGAVATAAVPEPSCLVLWLTVCLASLATRSPYFRS